MSRKSGQNSIIILGLAAGKAYADIAREAGCSPRTVRRRAVDESIRDDVIRARDAMVDDAVGRLSVAAAKAVDRLVKLLDCKSEVVQLQAARAILTEAVRLREHGDLLPRISELENRLAAAIEAGTVKRATPTNGARRW